MLQEIQVNKQQRIVYAMDENYNLIAQYPCSCSYYSGYNENGEPYSNAENGVYENGIYAEIYGTESTDVVYGWAYIDLGTDNGNAGRGRALHGGRDLEPYQPYLQPTLGCFRMYNNDILHLANMYKFATDNGVKVVITVV